MTTHYAPFLRVTRSKISDYQTKEVEFMYLNWANRRIIDRWAVYATCNGTYTQNMWSVKWKLPLWIEIA